MCVLDFFCQVLYGLEEGETASPEHLENCKKMANLNFIDNHKARELFLSCSPSASTRPIFFALFLTSQFHCPFWTSESGIFNELHVDNLGIN